MSKEAFDKDLFVYDVPNNRLFQITDTPLLKETLSDITLLTDGRLRLVWASDEDGASSHNIWGATFHLPNLAPTLAHSLEAGYGTNGVDPDSGTTTTSFTYKVVYADADAEAPTYMDACIDGACHAMAVDSAAAADLRDGNYRNGEQFSYTTTLSAGAHTYRFEASDGTDTARLPVAGTLSGPSVSGPAPAQQITDLIALVMSFNLQHGIENSLDAKLQNVLDALNAARNGNTATACNKLNAFINEVQAQSGHAITVSQANQLIAACAQVKTTLGCP